MLRDDLTALNKRLESTLNDYQTLANSDPSRLRALIPPSEIWRLFVEHVRQPRNYDLSKYLHLDSLEHGLGKTALDFSLTRVATLHSITKPNWPSLVRILNLNQSQQDTIKLGDLLKYNQGWFHFELSEPGYIKGLYRAFQCIFEQGKQLDLNYLLKVHLISTEGVSNTNHHRNHFSRRGGKIRTAPFIRFPLRTTSASEQGIFEILEDNANYHYFTMRATPTHFHLRHEESSDTFKNSHPDLHQRIATAHDNKTLAKALYEVITTGSATLYFNSEQKINTAERLTELTNQAITLYNARIRDAVTPMEKLDAIVSVIHTLECIHLFEDANCRTLCMITVNYLLINCGLPLSLISDPNRFDAKSHLELIETLIEGMEHTFQLIKAGSICDIQTADLLALADKPNTLGATRKYFDEAIAIEERARRRLCLALPSGEKRAFHEEKSEFESEKKYRRLDQ